MPWSRHADRETGSGAQFAMAGQPFESRTSVITCDTQGIVQEYAADAADLFGWSQDEVIGKMSVAMFHVPKNVPTLVPRLLGRPSRKANSRRRSSSCGRTDPLFARCSPCDR